MDERPRQLSLARRVAYSALALLLGFAALEIVARCVFYQVAGGAHLAAVEGWDWLRDRVGRVKVEAAVRSARGFRSVYREARIRLRRDEERAMRETLRAAYAEHFERLLVAVREVGSELIVVDFLEGRGKPFGDFIAGLAARHGVEHLDLAASIGAIERDHRVLAPADGHLTRHANLIVADGLVAALAAHATQRSGRDYDGTPTLLGDCIDRFPGGPSQLLEVKPQLGFLLICNSQGLRGVDDVEIPKRRQRVLCLGDSYTFCTNLNEQDTWQDAMRRSAPHLEVLNAGISGYTIADQLALFVERAQHCAPDITLLQVCENDIIEMLGYVSDVTGRAGTDLPELPGESAFLERVRASIGTKRGR